MAECQDGKHDPETAKIVIISSYHTFAARYSKVITEHVYHNRHRNIRQHDTVVWRRLKGNRVAQAGMAKRIALRRLQTIPPATWMRATPPLRRQTRPLAPPGSAPPLTRPISNITTGTILFPDIFAPAGSEHTNCLSQRRVHS